MSKHFQKREADYPVEDIFGDEIMSNDIYFIMKDGSCLSRISLNMQSSTWVHQKSKQKHEKDSC